MNTELFSPLYAVIYNKQVIDIEPFQPRSITGQILSSLYLSQIMMPHPIPIKNSDSKLQAYLLTFFTNNSFMNEF